MIIRRKAFGYRGGLGTDHRSAGILPATICRQDGGTSALPTYPTRSPFDNSRFYSPTDTVA